MRPTNWKRPVLSTAVVPAATVAASTRAAGILAVGEGSGDVEPRSDVPVDPKVR